MTALHRLPDDQIGFAVVRRRFESGGRIFLANEELPRDFLLKMPRGNRDAMTDSRQIEIYPIPRQPVAGKKTAGELLLRAAGIGKYDVIQGTVVAAGLTKDEATAYIAAGKKPEPKQQEASTAVEEGQGEPTKRAPAKRGTKRRKKGKRAKGARRPRAAAAPKPDAPAHEQKPVTATSEPSADQENGPID